MSVDASALAAQAYGAWHGGDLADMRRGFDEMLPRALSESTVEDGEVGGVTGRWVGEAHRTDSVVLYLHGGGFILGSARGYEGVASRIALASGSRVFVPDYRLAPENPFPCALVDAVAAYDGLIGEVGVNPRELVVAGDSAGGGLALSLLQAIGDRNGAIPAGGVLWSPFCDLSLSGSSIETAAGVDPVSTRASAVQMATAYLGELDTADPRASALFGDFARLPKLLIQVGTNEILLDDAIRVAENARNAGVEVDLQISYGMFHVFQMFADVLPAAQRAIDEVGTFIRHQTGRANR